MLPFSRVAIIGLGLIGSSLARAVRLHMPTVRLVGYDGSAAVRARVDELGLIDDIADTPGGAVIDADLVVLCVPVGQMGAAIEEMRDDLPKGAIVSDVGSVKASVAALAGLVPEGVHFIPAHPVAGTEKSGPDAGFAELFHPETDPDVVIVDFRRSRVVDQSALQAIEDLAARYAENGKTLRLRHLSRDCHKLLKRAGQLMVDADDDPDYALAVDYNVRTGVFGGGH